jgi:hypothetical protein
MDELSIYLRKLKTLDRETAGGQLTGFLTALFKAVESAPNAAAPNPSHAQLRRMADLFQAAEATYGALSEEDAMRHLPGLSRLKVRKILRALRDAASIPLKQLETPEREAAVRLMKLHTPLRALISRHTRELLRRYQQAGKLKALIANREVEDRFVEMTPAERLVYEQVEDYIGSTYDNAAAEERTAVGFVMTIYRRRLAGSFHALTRTLEGRLATVGGQTGYGPTQGTAGAVDEDVPDDELGEDEIDAEEAVDLERQALALEEIGDIRPDLLPPGIQTRALGPRDWSWQGPGMPAPVRVTTDPDYYEQHPDSTELWSPGSPVFPVPEAVADSEALTGVDYRSLVAGNSATRYPTDR